MTYLKNFIGTKSLDTKQCPAGLSPRIIPHYPTKHLWENLGMAKNHIQYSMYLRVAFDSFAVRFTFIFSEGLFACL